MASSLNRRLAGAGQLRRGGRSAGSSSWTPLALASRCESWLDPGIGYTLNGTALSALADQGPTARSWVQADATEQPAHTGVAINGRQAMSFDGTNDVLGVVATVAASGFHTISMVLDPTNSTGTTEYALSSSVGLIAAHLGSTTGNSGWWDGAWRNVAAAATGAQVLTWHLSSATASKLYRNGVQIGSDTAHTQNSIDGNVAIGGQYASIAATLYVGKVGEVVIGTDVTDAERAVIDAYLMAGWGI